METVNVQRYVLGPWAGIHGLPSINERSVILMQSVQCQIDCGFQHGSFEVEIVMARTDEILFPGFC
jgi:hypothetical protein